MYKHFYTGVGAGILFALCAVASPAQAQAPQAIGPVRPTSPAAQPAPAVAQPATAQPASATAQPASAPTACTAAVRGGDAIPVRPTPVAVDAAITQAIGDSVKAEFPAESKIVVSRAVADPASAQVVKLTLDTSAAAPGEWALLLKGTTGDCTGKVRITASK